MNVLKAASIFLLTFCLPYFAALPDPPTRHGGAGITPVPPKLEILEINPASPVEKMPWSVHFRFTNNGVVNTVLNGWIQAIAYDKTTNSKATGVSSSDFAITNLQINGNVEGDAIFDTTGQIQTGWVELTFYSVNGPVQHRHEQLIKAGKATAVSTAVSEFSVFIDRDRDGIDDNLEHQLLERFRPYYMFSYDKHNLYPTSGDEEYAPVDAHWYITQSELLTSGSEGDCPLIPIEILTSNPDAILLETLKWGSSKITENTQITQYHINPKGTVDDAMIDIRLLLLLPIPVAFNSDPGRHGNEWSEVLAKKNVGLYGHVVPVKLKDPYAFSFKATTARPPLNWKIYYKIEYWQLFGYNEAYQSNIGNHEGDWTSVQLIYDPDPKANIVRSVFHFAHGLLFRFDITAENNAHNVFFCGSDSRLLPCTEQDGNIKEYRGLNYIKYGTELNLSDLDISNAPPKIIIDDDQVAKAQNNLVRFFKDSQTGEFSHPVVYIENGSHEFYPSENWTYYGSPNHNGKSYHYLTSTPPNLGEIDYPLNETDEADVVLWFNGYWGAYGNYNNPPPGPVLHKNWTVPLRKGNRTNRSNLDLGF